MFFFISFISILVFSHSFLLFLVYMLFSSSSSIIHASLIWHIFFYNSVLLFCFLLYSFFFMLFYRYLDFTDLVNISPLLFYIYFLYKLIYSYCYYLLISWLLDLHKLLLWAFWKALRPVRKLIVDLLYFPLYCLHVCPCSNNSRMILFSIIPACLLCLASAFSAWPYWFYFLLSGHYWQSVTSSPSCCLSFPHG